MGKFITNDYLGGSLDVILQKISQDGYWQGEVTQNRRDGAPIPIMSTLSIITNDANQTSGFIAVNRDITNRKRAEEILQDIIEKNPISIQILDKEGFTLHVNPAHTKLFGAVPPSDYSMFTDAQLIQLGLGEMIELMKNGEVVHFPDSYFNIHDSIPGLADVPVWVRAIGFPLNDNNNKPERFIFMHENITARKQAEAEIQLKNEELIKLNAVKDKFFSIIAHDLRSPFQTLLGFTRMMVEDLPTLTLDEIQKIAVSMRNSANKLFNLLDNLLEWSQTQRGLGSFKPESFILVNGIIPTMELIRDAANKKMIGISYDLPEDLRVMADERMFESLIRNLVFNAVKFTPKGGKISIAAKQLPDNFVEISIRDTGIGMSQHMIDHLFRIDEQPTRPGTGGEPGTGLGLIICKDFIEKHGGKIWVESEEGKGSIFYFTIPQNERK
jgi:signal transduction histidine kinase